MNDSRRLFFVGIAVLFLVLSAQAVMAIGNLELEDQVSIAPVSIPVDSNGNAPDKVGMVRMDLLVDPVFGGTSDDLESFSVELIDPSVASSIANLYVYVEQQDGGTTNDGKFDTDSDNLVHTITGVDLSSAVAIDIDPDITIYKSTHATNGGTAYVYVALDFVSGAIDTAATVGCNIIDVNDDTSGDPPPNTTEVNLDNYTVTVSGDTSGLGLAAADPGPGDTVTALQLDFGVADTSLFSAPPTGGYATVDKIRFHNMGTAVDEDFDEIIVFLDKNGDEIYSGSVERHGSGTMSGGYATVNLTTQTPLYTDSGNEHYTYYAAVRLSSNPTHGNTVALRVEDPSNTANISFADGIDDTAGGLVENNTYDQVGFIADTETDPQPASPAEFTIITDPDPPQVSATTPLNLATGVSRYLTEIRAVFNEAMDAATIVDANFELRVTSGAVVSGSVTFDDPNDTLIFTLGETLSYDTNYTATVTGPGGVADLVHNEMASDYVWTFQTELPIRPYVTTTFPDEDAVDVLVDIASVRAVFSEPMKPGTIIGANFSLVGPSGSVDGTVSYDDTGGIYRLVFVPDSDLEYDEIYTATVTTDVEGEDDLNMFEDEVWQFTTLRLYPEFDEPIAIKNRIGSGANDQALIFITQPPGGASTRMSVQAFTTTGKLVRSFYKNVPWSTIGEDPIPWDGTNDRGQDLGPGLYFVQIRAANYKRVLKVMIVR